MSDIVTTPLNIDNLLGKVRNRVALVGVELEGAWRRFPEGERWDLDMSVFENPSPEVVAAIERLKITKTGELVSEPMLPGQVGVWMKRCYPTYVNETCGLHVHMSFHKLKHYAYLMKPEYPATIREYLARWAIKMQFPPVHHIWNRLSGKNKFCHDAFWPDLQAGCRKDHDHDRKGNRYTDINFAFTSHKTIECRLLPMMSNHEMATNAVHEVLKITSACLVKLGEREKKHNGFLEDLEVEDSIETDVVEL